MLISAISSNSQILLPLNQVAASRPSASSSASASSTAAAVPASTSSTSNPTSGTASPAKSQSSHGGGGGGGAASSVASSIDELVSGYSETVDGKQYSGSIEKSGNTYTASIPGLAGASASGSTEVAAENGLSQRISVLA